MTLAKYNSSLAYDQIIQRGVPGQVARITDPSTGFTVDGVLDVDGRPVAAMVTNSQGYLQPFQVEDGPAIVHVAVGSIGYHLIDLEVVGKTSLDAQRAAEAAERSALLVGVPAGEVIRSVVEGDLVTPGSAMATALSSTIAGQAVGRGEFLIFAADYGVVGDGITENDAMLQAAVDAGVAFGPKTVIMPSGNFYVKHVVQLRSGTTIEGTKETTFVKTAAKTATMVFAILSEGRKGYGSGAVGVTLRGFRIKGDFANGVAAGAIGANHGSDILVDNCEFVECLGKGHLFDLQGCDGVRFVDCKFLGARYPAPEDRYNEAIQLDNSTRNGTSVLDGPGSYDGLPTRNIVLERCQFLPITVGGVEYPAPVPLGSHAGVGDYWHENIRVKRCIIDTPGEDPTSPYRGIFHFVSARDITLDDVWIFNRKNVVTRAFNLITQASSIAIADADISGAASVPLAIPKVCSGIRLRKVNLVGFSNPNTGESVLVFRGNSTTARTSDIVLEDVNFIDSYVTDLALGTGSNHIELAFADDITIRGGGTNGCRRFVYYATVSNLTVDKAKIKNSSNGVPVNGVSGASIKLLDLEFDNFHGAIYDANSVGLEVRGTKLKNPRSTNVAAIDISGASRFKLSNNDGAGPYGIGIRVRGNSKGGISSGNDMTGFATPYSVDAGSTVLSVANLP